MTIYKPREDSFLLEKSVKKYARGRVLDMGTGSGIQAFAAAGCKKVTTVTATDVQKSVIAQLSARPHRKIRWIRSDLFSNVEGRFDTIMCNPPYLPHEPRLKDITLDGGRKGYEFVERFLIEAPDHLTPNGQILLLFSSLTNKKKIDGILEENLLTNRQIGAQKLFYERLYVYQITKSKIRNQLERKLTEIRYFAKGKRGLIYRAKYQKLDVVAKIANPKSTAVGRIANECTHLKKLNKHNIGPSLVFCSKDVVCYRYVSGPSLLEYIETAPPSKVARVLVHLLGQMRTLDQLGINKEEMHHPDKHIFVPEKPVLLDFERCYPTKKPHNVTQFCQYLARLQSHVGISFDAAALRALAQRYKKDPAAIKEITALVKRSCRQQRRSRSRTQ